MLMRGGGGRPLPAPGEKKVNLHSLRTTPNQRGGGAGGMNKFLFKELEKGEIKEKRREEERRKRKKEKEKEKKKKTTHRLGLTR